ncbi:MAG: hypothetical protein V7719_01165 [Psychroserpens sp.]|uniref:hypothetical protein n=1 Tax=Psychroserpens sp. TaxID=2020870 RepID=UPI003003211D
MQDQNNLPESNPPAKKTNLFRDWWEEMCPRDFVLTFKNYFFNHKQFFDEVFSEQWDNKVKPMAFLFTAIGVSLIIGAISPWGLKSEVSPEPAAWDQIIDSMGEQEEYEFMSVFKLQWYDEFKTNNPPEYDENTNNSLYSEYIEQELMTVTGQSTPLTVTQLKDYFEKEEKYLLASRADYVLLKRQVEHDKEQKELEIGEIEQVVYLNLFVLWCMLYWLIAHRLFKKAKRTSRETVFVFMYGLGMLVFFVYIPFIAIAGASEDHVATLGAGTIIIFGISLFLLYRIFSIFKYTHNTGFFKLVLVYIKTFLVAGLVGLLLFTGAFYLLDLLL